MRWQILLAGVATFIVVGLAAAAADRWPVVAVMPNNSMAPTIARGDRVIVDTSDDAIRQLRVGQIVMFVPRNKPNRRWVHRIAATAGDTIEYREGVLQRNGSPIMAPPPLGDQTFSPVASGDLAATAHQPAASDVPRTLEYGEFLLLSDDPNKVLDGRYWGLVYQQDILGVVVSHD